MITYPPGTVRRGHYIFPECVSEHAFSGWLPTKGELHKLLRTGEFDLIGDAPVFEGTFVQVTKKGEFVGILNHPNIVILGVLASTSTMLLPDLIIIARDKTEGKSKYRKLEIARLIPLELVEIYVHNIKERRLKIHMVTGRNYYLQLCAPDGEEGFQFERWMRLIYLLHLATDKAKAPSQPPSKDIGLHTIWKTASLPSETQYWLPAIMDKGSSGELKKSSPHDSSTRTEQKSKQSAAASKQSPSKSGAAVRPSPQQPSGIIPTEARTEKSASSRRPSAGSPPPLHTSVAVGTSEHATASVGIGPSRQFTLSEAVGPSQPGSQLGAWTSSQRKSIGQPGTLAAHESIPSRDSIVTERETWASGKAPIKLERSQKSRSLVQSTTSQLTQQKSSQSRSNAPDLVKSATEAQATSQSSRSARPLTQGEAGGLTSQSSSRKHSQPASRAASTRAPSATVPRSHMSAAVGSSDAYNKSVAVGPSEVGAMSVAVGPSKPASQASQVAPEKSKASQTSAFTAPQPTSHESRATPARSKTSGDAGAKILEDVKEEGEGAAGPGDRPVSREMSVKSKPSEKQGASAAPSGLPNQGRTSAPYSQMAGMNKEPEGAAGTRPVSREMSVKSKPSEKQGASADPSELPRQGRTSSPSSQMAGMEAQKAKSSKPLTSARPSRSPKPGYTSPSPAGRTSKGGSHLYRTLLSVAAGRSEPGVKSVAVGTSQPFPGGQSRPQSRMLEVDKSGKVRTIFSRKKSKSGDKTQPSSATEKQEPPRDQTSKSKSRLKNTLSSAKQRSSLTFVTIYSVLSSSMERLKHSNSNEEGERKQLLEDQLETVTAKPSKRVTISGVIGPSGKGVQTEEEPLESSEMNTLKADEICSTTATVGSEPGNLTAPQSKTVTSEATVVASNVESSASPQLGGSASNPILPSSRPSEKSALDEEAPTRTEVASLPPQSKISVDTDISTAGTKPAGAASDTSANREEQGQSSVQSQQQIKMEEGSQPSAVTRPPDQSRVSVGVGCSVGETKSAAVGPSVRGSLRDEAVGPSTTGGWKQQGESRAQSRQQSKMEDSLKPSTQPSAVTRPPDRSRISVGVGHSVMETKSAAVGPSVRGSLRDEAVGPSTTGGWKQQGESRAQSRQQSKMEDSLKPSTQPSAVTRPPDRSRISVGVGRSVMETKSAAVGPSVRGSLRDEAVGPSTTGGWKQQGESRAQSRQQSKMEDSLKPSTQPSAVTRPPDRSRISVGVGRSVMETKSAAVGPSVRGSLRDEAVGPSTTGGWKQQGESRAQSRQQSKMEDSLKPSTQPSAVTRPPDRSRISVGVGRSVMETKSAAVGPSVRGSLRDEAVGPSTTGGWKQQRESRAQSRQRSKTEEGQRPISKLFVAHGPPDRSRISVGVGPSVLETKSAAVGPSVVGDWKGQREHSVQSRQQSQMVDDWKPSSHPSTGPGTPDRSRMSVGVGRSIIETKSVGVGRSQRERVSEGAGPSKPGSVFIARNLREPSTRLQENSVFQPQGWLGTVETEDKPAFKATSSQIPRTTAASPGPSGGASRVVTPSGGVGSRVTKDASARSYN